MNAQNRQKPQQPNLPDGTWAISPEDKPKIRDFGRKLIAFVDSYANGVNEDLHMKIIAGGFQYFMEIQSQKAKLIGDNFSLSQEVLKKYGVGKYISEPFEDTPVEDASIKPSEGKDVPGPDAPAELGPLPSDGPEKPVVEEPGKGPEAPAPAAPAAPAPAPAPAPVQPSEPLPPTA